MRRLMKRYPLRVIAAVLFLIVGAEICGILSTPTYSAELAEARAAYESAAAENRALRLALGE